MKKPDSPNEEKADLGASGKPMIELDGDGSQGFVEAISQLMTVKKTGGIDPGKIADRITRLKKVLGEDWEPGPVKDKGKM